MGSIGRLMQGWILLIFGVILNCGLFAEESSLRVVTSIPPHAWMVEELAKGEREQVQVSVFLPTGADPHTFAATPSQVRKLSEADLWLLSGLEFEHALVPRIRRALPDLRIVDLGEVAREHLQKESKGHAEESHDGEESREAAHHDHGEMTQGSHEAHSHKAHEKDEHHGHDHNLQGAGSLLDPHTWLDPVLLRAQAEAAREVIQELSPDLVLTLPDWQIEAAIPAEGTVLLVHHAAFGHFTRRFGLEQVSVEIEGREPTARQMFALAAKAKVNAAEVIVVQPQFDPRSAKRLADLVGAEVVAIDPLAADVLATWEALLTAAGKGEHHPAAKGQDSPGLEEDPGE